MIVISNNQELRKDTIALRVVTALELSIYRDDLSNEQKMYALMLDDRKSEMLTLGSQRWQGQK